jgi:hypothetical protein
VSWRYFGRSGGGDKVFEIFRLPSELYKNKIGMRQLHKMERLLPDGAWKKDSNDKTMLNEYLCGWFDEDDEISVETVEELVSKWSTDKWPGRKE